MMILLATACAGPAGRWPRPAESLLRRRSMCEEPTAGQPPPQRRARQTELAGAAAWPSPCQLLRVRVAPAQSMPPGTLQACYWRTPPRAACGSKERLCEPARSPGGICPQRFCSYVDRRCEAVIVQHCSECIDGESTACTGTSIPCDRPLLAVALTAVDLVMDPTRPAGRCARRCFKSAKQYTCLTSY
jgi:hypothetical protein